MTTPAVASSATLTVSPVAGPVGSTITVSGQGYAPGTIIALAWTTGNASWVIANNPPEVTGVNVTSFLLNLATAQVDSSGAFSAVLAVPVDYGGSKVIQVLSSNGTVLDGKAVYTVEPSFQVSATSGPAGTAIIVNSSGLGYGLYSTNYHLLWDNKFVGYMTGISTQGQANFTFYAVGASGTHYIDVFEGYPGPAYLNPEQNPPGASASTWFPPLIPFHAKFTITSSQGAQASSLAVPLGLGSLVLVLAAPLSMRLPIRASHQEKRRGATRKFAAILLSAGLILAGTALFLSIAPAAGASTSFTPQATVVRPQVIVTQTPSTVGPQIAVTPVIVDVGSNMTVTGTGFAANSVVPVTWSTRQGNNLFGYNIVYLPMRNVTTDASGAFAFTAPVPVDLGGLHYVSDAASDTNATVFIERTASISSTQGPEGSNITIQLLGVGWDYNTNILAFDYDNSFIGYACGFSSQGNVSITITATGAPGLHTIDLYPSLWKGPDNTPAIYRYPLLTPQDHPESIPSFHFTYLITAGSAQTQTGGIMLGLPTLLSTLTFVIGALYALNWGLLPSRRLF